MYKLKYKLKSLFINKNSLYQEKLINELHNEHQNLFDLYTKIINEKDNKKILKLLKKFYYD